MNLEIFPDRWFSFMRGKPLPKLISLLKNTYEKMLKNKKTTMILGLILLLIILIKMMKKNKEKRRKNTLKRRKTLSVKSLKQPQFDTGSSQSETQKQFQQLEIKNQTTRYGTDIQTQKQYQQFQSIIDKKRDEFFFNIIKNYQEGEGLGDKEIQYCQYHEELSERQNQTDNQDCWNHPISTQK